MFDLLEDTRSYWQELNQLERAYQDGEISLLEVDARVKVLVAELGQSRRESLRDLRAATQHFFQQHQDQLLIGGGIALLTYAWAVLR